MNAVAQLLKYGGPPTCSTSADRQRLVDACGANASAVLSLLSARNGFYAFDDALHVFCEPEHQQELGLIAWNEKALWRADYDGMADDALFFAEDIFGVQFCLKDGNVMTFDPETGQLEMIGRSIDEWCRYIVQDPNTSTGWLIAKKWRETNGPLPRGKRLVPTIPFVLGGEFSVSNVKAIDAVRGMKFRASIARQIRDLPDGAAVELKVVD